MSDAVDLSVVIVNFNSAGFIERLLPTLRAQEFQVDGRPGTLEIILIENASRGEDAIQLEAMAAPDCRVIINTQNTGYGPSNNQGFHVARGRYHMVLNPDAMMLPGCIQELIAHLEHNQDTVMVCPMAFMDPAAQVMIPPNQLPTPELIELQTRAQVDHEAARENLRIRSPYSYEYWTATEPIAMPMLSGSCFVFRRERFIDELLFDPGFPLYYEDTDLFLRLDRNGEKMVCVPAAKFLHFWSQSADTHARGAAHRGRLAEQRYFKKHFGEEGLRIYEENRQKAIETKEAGRHIIPITFETIEPEDGHPPVFDMDLDPSDYFIEMAGNPIFTLAAGFFPTEEGGFSVSPEMWHILPRGHYYLRAVSRSDFETLKGWEVVKPG